MDVRIVSLVISFVVFSICTIVIILSLFNEDANLSMLFRVKALHTLYRRWEYEDELREEARHGG